MHLKISSKYQRHVIVHVSMCLWLKASWSSPHLQRKWGSLIKFCNCIFRGERRFFFATGMTRSCKNEPTLVLISRISASLKATKRGHTRPVAVINLSPSWIASPYSGRDDDCSGRRIYLKLVRCVHYTRLSFTVRWITTMYVLASGTCCAHLLGKLMIRLTPHTTCAFVMGLLERFETNHSLDLL